MRVFLIRHAESYSNTGGRVMSFTDLPLTEKGVQQAVRAGEALRGRLRADAPLCAFCSPLRRAKQTAETVLGQLPAASALQESGCLREMELYVWDLAAGGDRVVKKNDHAMDDMRYFVTGVLGSGTAFAVWAPERKI